MKIVYQYIIPIAMLVFFVAFMNSGDFFKTARNESEDFPSFKERLENLVHDARWDEALASYYRLEQAWEKIMPRIQFAVEKDELMAININLSRLKAFIMTKDKNAALAELYEMWEHWNNLNQ